MMVWLLLRILRRAPRRFALAAISVVFPVATLAATLIFIDDAARAMTPAALAPVQIEMRALATSLDTDMSAVRRELAAVRGVQRVERFATAAVVVSAPGAPTPLPARLFAVDPEYLQNHSWVRAEGALGGAVLLSQPLRAPTGFGSATSVTLDLPSERGADTRPLSLTLPVAGTVDLRQARTWFEIPLGDVQGDVANVPLALLTDYATFERSILPTLRTAAAGAQVFNPGNTDLPPVSLEAHAGIDHRTYPSDPARAAAWSTKLRRQLERQTPGAVVVADNTVDVLVVAREDATNAKILFLLLGIPGALAAAGIGLAAASALAEAHRREDALLRLRGATSGQVARVTAAHAALAGLVGAALGLGVAALAVAAVTGRAVWRDIPPGRLALSALAAAAAGGAMVAVRLVPLLRASRRPEVANQRRVLEGGWVPRWRRARLDLVALGVAAAILGINVLAGGLRQTPIEGQTLALAFYVLLAPIGVWLGATLLTIRGLSALLIRYTRPDRSRPLGTWAGAALRWLGRRPARTGIALVLGALAIAFGTNVVTFVATYQEARRADVKAAFGADLRLTPTADPQLALPPLGAGVAATSPIRMVPARVGTDRKTIQAIDLASYQHAATVSPSMVDGDGVAALARSPNGVLVAKEIADGFSVGIGDTVTMTVFPDDQTRSRNLNLQVVGIYRSFPPTRASTSYAVSEPFAEMVVTSGALPAPLPPADFYLARVAPGLSPTDVAGAVRRQIPGFTVTTLDAQILQEQRGLTTLDLRGLGRLEVVAAGTLAAVGVAVLGAFLVLERRRESAVLRSVGATTRQILTAPAVEGAIAVFGSLAIGIPIGIGLSILSIRVLGLFFTLPPPLVVVPVAGIAGLAAAMVGTSVVALGLALRAVARQAVAPVLREP